jgi:hypothetical protein
VKRYAPLLDRGGWWCEGDPGSRWFGWMKRKEDEENMKQEVVRTGRGSEMKKEGTGLSGIESQDIVYEIFTEAMGETELPNTEGKWERRELPGELKRKG